MEATSWTLVTLAAAGDDSARSRFWSSYVTPIRAYLQKRWFGSPLRDQVEDAVQDVFIECFKEGGALQAADAARGGFRGFLFGVVRNVARRFEARRPQPAALAEETAWWMALPAREASLSRFFDREWALGILRQAIVSHEERVTALDDGSARRWQVLKLRIDDGLPVRQIAERLGEDTATVHNEYRRARREFKASLRDVVAFHGAEDLEAEYQRLIALLGEA